MFKIIINESNGKITELYDNDDRNITEYTNELATILDLNSISILFTSASNFICRPQQINSIEIFEEKELIPKSEGPLKDK